MKNSVRALAQFTEDMRSKYPIDLFDSSLINEMDKTELVNLINAFLLAINDVCSEDDKIDILDNAAIEIDEDYDELYQN